MLHNLESKKMATILNSDIKIKTNIADFIKSVADFNSKDLTRDNVLEACETYFFTRTTDYDANTDWWLVQLEQVKQLGEYSINKMTIETDCCCPSPWVGSYSPERYILIMAAINLQTDEFYIDPNEVTEELEEWLRLAFLLGELPTVYHDMQVFFPWLVSGTDDIQATKDMEVIYHLIDTMFPKEYVQIA